MSYAASWSRVVPSNDYILRPIWVDMFVAARQSLVATTSGSVGISICDANMFNFITFYGMVISGRPSERGGSERRWGPGEKEKCALIWWNNTYEWCKSINYYLLSSELRTLNAFDHCSHIYLKLLYILRVTMVTCDVRVYVDYAHWCALLSIR